MKGRGEVEQMEMKETKKQHLEKGRKRGTTPAEARQQRFWREGGNGVEAPRAQNQEGQTTAGQASEPGVRKPLVTPRGEAQGLMAGGTGGSFMKSKTK